MPTAAGHDARLSYLWEDDGSGNPDFATSAPDDSDNKPFGSDAQLSTLEGSNNAVRAFDPNDREAREVIEQNFSGSWSVEFRLTNPWWLRAVIANNVSTTGSSPTTHTFDGDVPYSMRIIVGNDSTGNERVLLGCVASSASISVGAGGMVDVTLNGAYADEEALDQTLTTQPTINERPLHFGQATVSRGGSTLSLVQNVSLSIENNIDLIPELGTRFAVDYSPKQRTADMNYTRVVNTNDDDTKRMYGGSTSPQSTVTNTSDITMTFDNGGSGTSKNSMTINLNSVFPQQASRSGTGDPEADLQDALSEMAPTIDATADNSQSTPR